MIDRDTFLRVKDWFIVCLELNRNELAFEEDLLSYKFNFSKELIEFLDEVNGVQYARCKNNITSPEDLWECNVLDSILEEAKKFKILENIRLEASKEYRYKLIQKLIQKMKIWQPYCMLVCNFLSNSKLSDTPEKYTNLCVLCKYWIDCQKALENNRILDFKLSELFI